MGSRLLVLFMKTLDLMSFFVVNGASCRFHSYLLFAPSGWEINIFSFFLCGESTDIMEQNGICSSRSETDYQTVHGSYVNEDAFRLKIQTPTYRPLSEAAGHASQGSICDVCAVSSTASP
jgi:hypothetical protein